MKMLSRKQTFIASIGIGLIIVTGLVTSGKVDMSSLSSNVLQGSTYICTENGQKRNLNEYNQAIRNKEQAQGKIKIMSGEIKVLNETITKHKKTITSHEGTIQKQTTTIGELSEYITKNCSNPKTTREKAICAQKKQQKSNLEQSNKSLTNLIGALKKTISQLNKQITQKNENIAIWNTKIEGFTKYIKDYESCNESLKGKLIITSPLMSGEVNVELEVGKRIELYKFSMSIPSPARAEINEIKFDTGFGPGNVELDDWYVTENSTVTSVYPCRLENNGQFRCVLERKESGNFGLENGKGQNYSLSAMVKNIKEPGSLKIYGISKEGVVYNGSRRDIDNQSTPIKINYTKKIIIKPVCANSIKEDPEQCDDGNTDNGDGCSDTCTFETHECEMPQWNKIDFHPACSASFYPIVSCFAPVCYQNTGKVFNDFPNGQASIEYSFSITGLKDKDSLIEEIQFSLKDTDTSKMQATNIRLATGIATDDIIAQCTREGNIIRCTPSEPYALKKQELSFFYLNAYVSILADHIFSINIDSIKSDNQTIINTKDNTSFHIQAYKNAPFNGTPGNFEITEDTKTQNVQFNGGLQTIYEFTIKATQGIIAVTDITLGGSWTGEDGEPLNFKNCIDPSIRHELFDGDFELYDGNTLLAKNKIMYHTNYTGFDIQNPLIIEGGGEKKLTVKARTKTFGNLTQCNFLAEPIALFAGGSYYTDVNNYKTIITPAVQ